LIQAELGAIELPAIGSISEYSKEKGPTTGKLATAGIEDLSDAGPFTSALDYYKVVADAKFRKAYAQAGEDKQNKLWTLLGLLIFKDIVQNTHLFKENPPNGPFHFNHMDMGMHNILVDEDFNFLAIIDWDFTQSAPVEVNSYPMPFPLVFSDAKS